MATVLISGPRNMKFYMEVEYKCTYKMYLKYRLYIISHKYVDGARLEVISDKFNLVRMFTYVINSSKNKI
jgi:hypothetical protein